MDMLADGDSQEKGKATGRIIKGAAGSPATFLLLFSFIKTAQGRRGFSQENPR